MKETGRRVKESQREFVAEPLASTAGLPTVTRLKPYFCVWPARLSACRRAQSHGKYRIKEYPASAIIMSFNSERFIYFSSFVAL